MQYVICPECGSNLDAGEVCDCESRRSIDVNEAAQSTERTIIGVLYENRQNPGQFSGRQYSYFSQIPIEVGDIVVVPVKNGEVIAQVAAVGLDRGSIAGFEGSVKTIIGKAEPKQPIIDKEDAPVQEVAPETPSQALPAGQSLMTVTQIPIIKEQLRQVKEQITARVARALTLVCTEDTYKDVKTERTAMRNEFAAFEEQRKEIKRAILTPYEDFNRTYEDCVANIYKSADTKLKTKIDEVEQGLKKEKEDEARVYFSECAAAAGIDFLKFEDADVVISMNISKKKLKESVKRFVDKVADELGLIDTQEHKAEILVEYKQSLNVAQAITTVAVRHKAIDFERKRAVATSLFQEQQTAVAERVEEIIEEERQLAPPAEIELHPEISDRVEPRGDGNWTEIEIPIRVRYPTERHQELIQLCREFKEKLIERGFEIVRR